MGRVNKLTHHLKSMNKKSKRKTNLLVEIKGSIGQRVQKRHRILNPLYDDENINTDYIE